MILCLISSTIDNLLYIVFYFCTIGVLDEHKNELECTDHVYDVVGDMLHEVSGGSMGEKEVKDICSQLLKALKM